MKRIFVLVLFALTTLPLATAAPVIAGASCARKFKEITSQKSAARSRLWPLGNSDIQQEFDSAATSINASKLPAAINALVGNRQLLRDSINLDIGGGRFENVTRFLKSKGIRNLNYDPFNQPREHNRKIVDAIAGGNADTVTVNNVLNVIRERENWDKILLQADDALKGNGRLYIQIYEGATNWDKEYRKQFADLSAQGDWEKVLKLSKAAPTKSTSQSQSWQNNLPIEAYLLCPKRFPNAVIVTFKFMTSSGKMSSVKLITAKKMVPN